MRKLALASVLALLGTAIVPGSSPAQCDFNPGKGAKLRIPMVRAFEQCWSAYEDTTTEAGAAACSTLRGEPVEYVCSATGRPCQFPGVPVGCSKRICGWSSTTLGPASCVDNSDCENFLPPYTIGDTCRDVPDNECVATEATEYAFADGGSCSLLASSKVTGDCSRLRGSDGAELGLPSVACHVTSLRAKCRGIVESAGGTPIGEGSPGGPWLLRTVTRVTLDDRATGDMTMVDLWLNFVFDGPERGSLNLRTTTAEVLPLALGTTGAALPPCTLLQPVSAQIFDPEGRIFATAGLATQP